MAQLNFDANQVKPSAGVGDPIPAAWYNAAIVASELKPTSKGDGTMLALTFSVLDGAFANRKVFVNLNIRNPNPTAQEIAYADLSAIARAVGVMQIGDSEQLHNRPLKIKVNVRPAKGEYEASNGIKAYKNINEQVDMGLPAGSHAPQQGFGAPGVAAGGVTIPVQQPMQQQQFQQPMQQQQQQFQQPAQQMQQQPAQFQQAQQPWQQPAQQPVQQQQFQQPQQQMQQPAQQQMQHPAAQHGTEQPWAQNTMQQPQQTQQAAPQQQQMQQPMQQQQMQQNPAQGGVPPWAQQQG